MKKTFLTISLLLLSTVSSFAADVAKSTLTPTVFPEGFKVAVVDVGAVVSQSQQVQALQKEQKQKFEELQKWLETARADVQRQATKEGQEKLIKKYDEDFLRKQEAIKKNYAAKLEVIDKSISKVVADQAKAQKYNMVFAKNTVLYGGDDITPSIIKAVK